MKRALIPSFHLVPDQDIHKLLEEHRRGFMKACVSCGHPKEKHAPYNNSSSYCLEWRDQSPYNVCGCPAFQEHEDERSVFSWVVKTFPGEVSIQRRALSLVEEVAELAIEAGVTPEELLATINVPIQQSVKRGKVFGEIDTEELKQEVGDVQLCLYALTGSQNFSAHTQLDEKMTFNRSRPQSYYDAKQIEKADLGMPRPNEVCLTTSNGDQLTTSTS